MKLTVFATLFVLIGKSFVSLILNNLSLIFQINLYLIASFAGLGEAVKCYACTSGIKGCDDPFDKNANIQTTDCASSCLVISFKLLINIFMPKINNNFKN
jgi:hypothetical protein